VALSAYISLMKILKTVSELQSHLGTKRPGSVGFVPTMGALHEGHLSLVRKSCLQSDTSVVSIFVNPTQFNDAEDLKKYPRDIPGDVSLLKNVLGEKDILFIPEYKDLYACEKEFELDLEGLDTVMEGRHRPGHFRGVVRVVKLLFEVVGPDRAYFGQKDFQQLTIIKKMVDKLGLDIEIVACPILREPNGLAMSSRNERLTPDLREKAGIIHKTLSRYNKIGDKSDIPLIGKQIIADINKPGFFNTEYFEIVDNVSLKKADANTVLNPQLKYYGCIAVFAGEVRLIDNIEFYFTKVD
jgi:pantoate--beta-alanine ligase